MDQISAPSFPASSQTIGDQRVTLVAALNVFLDAINTLADETDDLATVRSNVSAAISHIANTTNAHGIDAIKTSLASAAAEIMAARGSASSLSDRLGVSLTGAGALRLTSLASKWINNGDSPTYVSTTSFTVPGDRRLVYIAGAVLRVTQAGDYAYGVVASSAFSGGVTTVTLNASYAVLTANLSAVELSLIAFDGALQAAIASVQADLTALTAKCAAHGIS